MGTVQGDIHDIGKNLVGMLLSCEGFHVVDLGVDVPPDTFIKAIREHKPKVLGLSCLMNTAFESMNNTVRAIKDAGLSTGLPVIIGGGQLDEDVCEYVGPDCWTKDAAEGVRWCKRIANSHS